VFVSVCVCFVCVCVCVCVWVCEVQYGMCGLFVSFSVGWPIGQVVEFAHQNTIT